MDRSRTEASPVLRAHVGMAATIVGLHLVGLGLVAVALAAGGGTALTLGIAVTAYLLGARHAFDADHIAAIDNATRRLSLAGKRSESVGFWFSLGHSTVVLATVVLLVAGVGFVGAVVGNDQSPFRDAAALWGASVSVLFVFAFGLVNALALVRMLRAARTGTVSGLGQPAHVGPTGPLFRVFGHVAEVVNRPWKMYPLGFLFGLGFDTAATIGLFVTSGAASMRESLFLAVALPFLFTAGMSLFDTLDGVFMNRLYGWAAGQRRRTLRYDLIVTSLSVIAAFVVVIVVGAGVVASVTRTGWSPPIDLEYFGFAVVAVFLSVAITIWVVRRLRRLVAQKGAGL